MKLSLKTGWKTLKEIIDEYGNDKVPKLAAALSYYTAFSLAPLLLITIAVAGLIFGREVAQGSIVEQLQGLIGRDGAQLIQTAMEKTSQTEEGMLATIVSIGTLVLTATAAFIELQDSLNIIWKVRSKPGGAIWSFIKNRLLSLSLVVGVGFLLLVSLVISAALTALNNYLSGVLPVPAFVLEILNQLVSFFVIFVMFSAIYRILPDVNLSWKDVRIGAIVTTLLFVLGKFLVGLYLGGGSIGSTFGAAGSLAILLVWVYYSAQIVFLGAEFTYVYAKEFGSGVKPAAHAEKIEIRPLGKKPSQREERPAAVQKENSP